MTPSRPEGGPASRVSRSPDAEIGSIPPEELARAIDGLVALGLERARLCRAAGLESSGRDATDRVPIDRLSAVLSHACEATGDDSLGLRLAQVAPLSHLLSHLAASQPTLGDALDVLCRFQRLLFGSRPLEWRRDGSPRLLFGLDRRGPMSHVADFYLATFCLEIQAWGGASARPREVVLPGCSPETAGAYGRLLDCPVRARAGTQVVVLARGVAAHRLPTANPRVARSLRELAVAELTPLGPEPVHIRARRAIRSALEDGRKPDCPALARALGMSRRTLQRRLAEEGLSFRRLLDEVRREMTLDTMRDLSEPPAVHDLAHSARFSNPSAFSRAFRRWTGVRPSDYSDSANETV